MFRHISMLICLCLTAIHVFGSGNADELILEQRTHVGLRMIGHELLQCTGDSESRVLPIQKIEDEYDLDRYRISFENEFGFDPDDVINIVTDIMAEYRIATDYMVVVEDCETKDDVHGFAIGKAAESDMVACFGRVMPKACYEIVISIWNIDGSRQATAIGESGKTTSNSDKSNPYKSALFIIPILFVVGFVGFAMNKKKPVSDELDLIKFGATTFNKRKMTIKYKEQNIELSHKETELLSLLQQSANEPVEREIILRQVWGDNGDYIGRTLDVFISKLRKKLQADPDVKIVNVRGVGYKLVC